MVDTRLIGKPKEFSGKSEDWKDWSLILYAYCGAIKVEMEAKKAAGYYTPGEVPEIDDLAKTRGRHIEGY